MTFTAPPKIWLPSASWSNLIQDFGVVAFFSGSSAIGTAVAFTAVGGAASAAGAAAAASASELGVPAGAGATAGAALGSPARATLEGSRTPARTSMDDESAFAVLRMAVLQTRQEWGNCALPRPQC